MIELNAVPFALLTTSQLYDILTLREEVFTVEQKCTEQDLDGLDKYAVHIIGLFGNELIATGRILPPDVYKPKKVSFGRLAIKKTFRRKGYGDALMKTILQYIEKNYPNIQIDFSAQFYLKNFYAKHGFIAYGDTYDEAGIVHIAMKSPPEK